MKTTFKTEKINGVEIFYREAGDSKNPTLVKCSFVSKLATIFRRLSARNVDCLW